MPNVKDKQQFALKCFSDFLNLNEDQQVKMKKVCKHLDHFEIVKPAIVLDLLSGLYSREGIANAYMVSESKVRRLGVKLGVYQITRERKTLIGVERKRAKKQKVRDSISSPNTGDG